MASKKFGTVFFAEVVKHCRVIHWLCGFTRNCQYVSQSSLASCLIASYFVCNVYFHCFSSCLIFVTNPGVHYLTRLALWRFSLTTSIILIVAPATIVVALSTYFSRESKSVNRMSLWDSSNFGRSTFLPSSNSC